MNVRITITNTEGNVTGPFDLYSNDSLSPFDTGVTLNQLEVGYTVDAPSGTETVRAVATSGCGEHTFYCDQLTHFYMSYSSYVTTESICTDDTIIWMDAWHNGTSHPYPAISDMVYTDELGTNLLYSSSGSTYWAYSSTGVGLPEGYFRLDAGDDPVKQFTPCT